MAVGFLVILGFAGYAAKSELPDWAVMRWSSVGALALIYGFKRELDAIGVARTIGVFLAVCLFGATIIGGSTVLLVLWADHTTSRPSEAVIWALAIAPSIVFVGGTWWVSRRLDRARHAS